MHSWRVLILPYIEQQKLYARYRFDEPWDGPNNRQLHAATISLFNCPSDTGSDASPCTNYLAMIGPDTMWPETAAVSEKDIVDGPASTLLLVEVANSGVHWMEPRDLRTGELRLQVNAKRGTGISSRHSGGAMGLFAYGRARRLSDTLSPASLRALLTRAADDDWDGL